ncbi:hypothetical protein HDU96_008438 [Phlyctochytrium bullatum]|nr:hypothetical protein HDU96_008438 [Phlyctochytrium bullatum]
MFRLLLSAVVALIAFTGPSAALVVKRDSEAKSYIVVFRKSVNDTVLDAHKEDVLSMQSLSLMSTDDGPADPSLSDMSSFEVGAVKGYALKMLPDTLEDVKNRPEVAYIEEDGPVELYATQPSPANWGLRRLSKRFLPLPESYTYPDSAGFGVNVYVLDSGTFINHFEFEGRAFIGTDTTDDKNNVDGVGHGTHVAGIIGSRSYGVAKRATIFAVKVFNTAAKSQVSWVVAGLDWAVNHARANNRPCVINMSFGRSPSTVLDDAANAAIRAGCAVVAASGNKGQNACDFSPGRVSSVITVASSTITDEFTYYSNYGTCVDIVAPGEEIASTYPNNQQTTLSGTSMASPHVAGAMAVAMSSGRSSAAAWDYLRQIARATSTSTAAPSPCAAASCGTFSCACATTASSSCGFPFSPAVALSDTLSHTLSHSFYLTHSHAISLTHSLSHTLSLSQTLSHTLSYSIS